MTEFEIKQQQIRDLLDAHGLDALLITQISNFAWATCGGSAFVNSATMDGVASLLITPTGRYLLTNTIEAPRMEQEEQLKAQGWEFVVTPWHDPGDVLTDLTAGLKLGADSAHPAAADLTPSLIQLRSTLQPAELDRFRDLGQRCAGAMDVAIRAVRPGVSEYEIAGTLAYEAQRRGAQPIVNLIAVDERIYSYRHPIPTAKIMDDYAMLVLCGRRHGLVASITRLIHFGKLPAELRRKAEAVAKIDAAFIAATRPGKTLGEVFAAAQDMYAATGYAGEWKLHHQGGTAAYEPRETVATPASTEVVQAGQVYAWNPSITGVKSEDTILVGEGGNEVLTSIEGWPTITVELEGQAIERPAILEVV